MTARPNTEAASARAEELHLEAMALDDEGEFDGAMAKYLEALELDSARPETHYNIGLIHKYRAQWAESMRYNKQAAELDPDDEAVNWNLAIAATALRDWKTARSVWHGLGMPIEEGEDPIEGDFGITPVRLNPDEDGEVVWARRIDPVRARIESIPFPRSGFGCGDIVLHDGAAVGYREFEGRQYPVFNVLELFESSDYLTYEAQIIAEKPEDIEALRDICAGLSVACEDWTTSVKIVCRQCSEGQPHEHRDQALDKDWKARHVIGLAAIEERVIQQALTQWQSGHRKVESLELALGPEDS